MMAAPPPDKENEHQEYERNFSTPYGREHPVPTIQGYRKIQEDREQKEGNTTGHQSHGIAGAVKRMFKSDAVAEGDENAQGWAAESENQNTAASRGHNSATQQTSQEDRKPEDGTKNNNAPPDTKSQDKLTDTSQAVSNETDPKAKRRAMKQHDPEKDSKSRQVTDPVTHMPVDIHDFTETELNQAPANLPEPGHKDRPNHSQTDEHEDHERLQREKQEIDSGYKGMQRMFPPPSFEALKKESAQVYQRAMIFSIMALGTTLLLASGMAFWTLRHWDEYSIIVKSATFSMTILVGLSGFLGVYIGSGWLSNRIKTVWDDETWASARKEEKKQQADVAIPESSMWLNFMVAAIWPLVNPDLFNSLVDTLEDVMQASLPKIVRMIAIEDFGQGKSAIRILGIRSLPAGAADESVSQDGKVRKSKSSSSDRDNPGQGEVNEDDKNKSGSKDEDEQHAQEDAYLAEGLEAESGDFLNLEIAFSYRAVTKGKGLKQRSQNAHLYLVFYLPSNIPVPVWVAVDGIVGIIRMRIQIAPDPPFVNLCTLSFMGQPKASISCVPLLKKGPNLMDIPFLSSFVQSSIDAALAEYVAPKSITLDLKQMLQGDDFKKDSTNRGVLFIKIHSASGMESGDTKIPLIKDGSSDCYMSCGWAKFSKSMWSTRIIVADMQPSFEEHYMMLVGPGELNADERLRLQLWDSDRTSADDDLGRVEVDLKELMNSKESKGKMWQREDSFVDLDGESSKPGNVKWEVGYFEKVGLTQDQFDTQSYNPDIRSMAELKKTVNESAKKKLREAPRHVREQETSQQQKQEFYEQESALICSASPPKDFPSGILSVQIHNAYGLEISSLRKKTKEEEDEDGEDNPDAELPSPYCSIIVNGRVVYKTRTKPKNSNPFYNAGMERFVRSWKDAEVIVAVRDSRIHENDPLLGIIHLPLEHVFEKRAQTNETYPLCGGVGYGKLRVSMIFRAIDIKLPMELQGWDYGTLEIGEEITSSDLPSDIQGLRLKLSTSIEHKRMHSNKDGSWRQRRDKKIYLAVSKRYASSMLVEFRSNRALKDKTSAWAVLWLKDIPDDEEKSIDLPVWTGDQGTFKRVKDNVLQEMGEKIGTIKLQLKLYAGLYEGHKRLKDANVKNVMECLAIASENREIDEDDQEMDKSGSSSDSDDSNSNNSNGPGDSGSPINKIKDYKEKSGTLHRQHRGLMQWKLARKADWAQSKLTEDLPNKIKNTFSRKGKVQGVETET